MLVSRAAGMQVWGGVEVGVAGLKGTDATTANTLTAVSGSRSHLSSWIRAEKKSPDNLREGSIS